MPMMPSDFPATVSPMGGSAPQGAPPMPPQAGALNQTAAMNAGANLMQEVRVVAQAAEALIVKLRQIPGIDKNAFEKGVAAMKEGITLVATSVSGAR